MLAAKAPWYGRRDSKCLSRAGKAARLLAQIVDEVDQLLSLWATTAGLINMRHALPPFQVCTCPHCYLCTRALAQHATPKTM